MPYRFEDLCDPNFEYFEYHRAEQLEFDFILTNRIFAVFNEDGRELAEAVKAEEPRIHQSFQDHGRHMTSCLYRKLIKGFELPKTSGPDAPEYVLAVYDNYLGLKLHRCLTPKHAAELEEYLSDLLNFANLEAPGKPDKHVH